MREVYGFLREAGVCFLATCEDGQPRLRPIGSLCLSADRLCFLTDRTKAMSRQLHLNPRLELCAAIGDDWLRVEGSAVLDDSREARDRLPEAVRALAAPYCPAGESAELWYLRNCAAARYSGTELLKTWKF